MTNGKIRRLCIIGGGLLGVWLGVRYALPLLLPFLIGTGLALAAEPLTALLCRRGRLKRWMASGIAVTGAVILLVGVLVMTAVLLVRQAGRLSTTLPELLEGVTDGLGSLEQWLLARSDAAPEGLRRVYTDTVSGVFSGSSTFLEGLAGKLFSFVTGLLKALTGGFFAFATAVLSAFMISARLPRLRRWLGSRLQWQKYRPMLRDLGSAVTGWLSAQLKLSAVAFAVLLMGFWLLRIPRGILWAAVIALVDVLPVLGCGTVLVPWSLISLLQGRQLQGLGLLGLYALIWLLRSVLEPKLLGKELGLDPLVTLVAVYTGYQLLGIAGMLLAPVLAVAMTRFFTEKEGFSP